MNYNPELTKYAKHLAIKYEEYKKYQYSGKNGADSDNEKGFWRGMAEAVLGILTDLKRGGLIEHSGILGDKWPKSDEPVEVSLHQARIKISVIHVEFDTGPSEFIYTPSIPKELEFDGLIPSDFYKRTLEQQKAWLLDPVRLVLSDEITFDTPDEPVFEVGHVDFDFELIS